MEVKLSYRQSKSFASRCFILALAGCTLSMPAAAQVHVRNEPRHHNVFENEHVRVLDVYLAPGDTTQYHLHNTPSVFVFLTKTTTSSQLEGQPSSTATSVARSASFDSLARPRIHRVWNVDSNWFHVMDIELVGKQPTSVQSLPADNKVTPLFSEQLVNGYRVHLEKNGSLSLPASAAGYLLISFGTGTVTIKQKGFEQQRYMQAGHYAWITGHQPAHLRLIGSAAEGFLLLQLK